MEALIDVAVLGQASALPGPAVPIEGDPTGLGRARLLPAGLRDPDRLLQHLTLEARSRQHHGCPAPLYLESRSAAHTRPRAGRPLGTSPAGLLCARAAVTAVARGQRPLAVAVGLLEATELQASGSMPLAEAGAAAWLAPANAPEPGPRRRLLVARTSALANAGEHQAFYTDLLCSAGVSPGDLGEALSASVAPSVLAMESAAISRWFPHIDLLQLAWRIGDAGPALGLMALLAAFEEDRCALVLASDPAHTCAAVVV